MTTAGYNNVLTLAPPLVIFLSEEIAFVVGTLRDSDGTHLMDEASCGSQLAFVLVGRGLLMDKSNTNKHYHIGYYEDGYDLEVTAYKRINEPVWDAYLPHYEADDFIRKWRK